MSQLILIQRWSGVLVFLGTLALGDVWFGDGPYKSRADAKLARSTIRVCPAVTPDEEKDEDGTN